MTSTNSPSLGSIGVPAYFNLPHLPDILVEWLALIPLVVHLTCAQEDFNLIGEACLRGSITCPLFPKLGQLKGIARLLTGKTCFLDRVAARSAEAVTTWDVSWGSVFQCSNASARDRITEKAVNESCSSVRVDVQFPPLIQVPAIDTKTNQAGISASERQSKSTETFSKNGSSSAASEVKSKQETVFRRYQNLTIIDLRQSSSQPRPRQSRIMFGLIAHLVVYISLCGIAVLAALSNAFGTAAIILLSCITKLVCWYIPVTRPDGYLANNESYKHGCMLTAAHNNSSSWFLYIGDRGVVDWLLNKPMLTIRSKCQTWLVMYFQTAHYVHLLIMTYVAAQKGWDGVCLLCLMVASEILKMALNWDDPVQQWFEHNGIACKATVAEMSGRTSMLGAVQLFHDKYLNPELSKENNSWMDDIMTPSPRLRAWTKCLHEFAHGDDYEPFLNGLTNLSDFDLGWIKKNVELSKIALDAIMASLQASGGGAMV